MYLVMGFDGRYYYTGGSEKIAREYESALKESGVAHFFILPEDRVRSKDEPTWGEMVRMASFGDGITFRKI